MNKSSPFEKGANPLSSGNTRAESPYFVVEKHESDGNNTLVSDLTSCTGALKVCNEKTSGKTQLGLQQVELYGRSVEVGVLREAYTRISNKESEPGSSEVVRVFGAGGSGKSYLVEKALRNFTATAHTGFFVSGKYDQQTQHELYSAIIVALTDLCDLVRMNKGNVQLFSTWNHETHMHPIHDFPPRSCKAFSSRKLKLLSLKDLERMQLSFRG